MQHPGNAREVEAELVVIIPAGGVEEALEQLRGKAGDAVSQARKELRKLPRQEVTKLQQQEVKMTPAAIKLMPPKWQRRFRVANDERKALLARAGLVPGLCLGDGSTSAAAVNKEFNVEDAAIVKGLVRKLFKAGITGRAAQEVLLADVLSLARSTLSWLGCSSVQEMKSLLQNVSVFMHNAGNPPCTMCGSRLWLARKTESDSSGIAACPSCAQLHKPGWDVVQTEMDDLPHRLDLLQRLDQAVPSALVPVAASDVMAASWPGTLGARDVCEVDVPAANIPQSRAYQQLAARERCPSNLGTVSEDEQARCLQVQADDTYLQWPPGDEGQARHVARGSDTTASVPVCATVPMLRACEAAAELTGREDLGKVERTSDITLALVTPAAAAGRDFSQLPPGPATANASARVSGTAVHVDIAGAATCATSIAHQTQFGGQSGAEGGEARGEVGKDVVATWGFIRPDKADQALKVIDDAMRADKKKKRQPAFGLFTTDYDVSVLKDVLPELKRRGLVEVIDQKAGEVVMVPAGWPHFVINWRACMKVARELSSMGELEGAIFGRQLVCKHVAGNGEEKARKLPEEYVPLSEMLEAAWQAIAVLWKPKRK